MKLCIHGTDGWRIAVTFARRKVRCLRKQTGGVFLCPVVSRIGYVTVSDGSLRMDYWGRMDGVG